MKALARALINAAAYFELSDESQVDPDLAMQALEEIAYNLTYASEAEKQAIAEVLDEMKAAERDHETRPEMLEFLSSFPVTFGLADTTELPEPDDERRINLL